MIEPGRKFVQGVKKYRYGFNGKENDNDVKGEGNQQDYGMRIYDPRLGRFLSVDPLTEKYSFYGPYNFAANTPINAVDIDGMEIDPNKNQNQSETDSETNGETVKRLENEAARRKSSELDPLAKFGVGIFKAGFNILGAVSELLAAPHQASRQSPEVRKLNFPLTGGDLSIKTNVANIFITPANAITNISNSNDPEVWGENLTYLAPFAKPLLPPKTSLGIDPVKPNSVFLGGAKGELFSKQKILEGNHLPTMQGIKDAGLVIQYKQASAIQMLYKEHRSFLSTGSSAEAIAFRAQETALLKKGDYMGAFELNANKIQLQYGSKYNDAINQAREHYKTNVVSVWSPPQ